MRALLVLTVLLPATASMAERPATTICFYDSKSRVAYAKTFDCYDQTQGRFYPGYSTDSADLKSFSCGARNGANVVSAEIGNLFRGRQEQRRNPCDSQCASAVQGIKNFRRFRNKTVIYGPALLPTSADTRFAFGLYNGSCSELDAAVKASAGMKRPAVEELLEETLINAAVDVTGPET